MRVRFKFSGVDGKDVELPLNYNEIVQGFIYSLLNKKIAKKIHDKGFIDKKSKKGLKLFTFSRLIPEKKPIINDEKIIFESPFMLTVSSIYCEFIQSLVENIVKSEFLRFASNEVITTSISVEALPHYKEVVRVKTLSPIVVYSTLMTYDNRKKTYYYNPFEKDFSTLVLKNLNRKSSVWFKTEEDTNTSYIKPINVKERILKYKGTIIKGWDGIFELKLSPNLFTLAFETGLGSKNSIGFGCIDILDR
ncbi:MAG: CRISPR-associated endoribonuclease Cas6 [Elusimicrobiales bacterium]